MQETDEHENFKRRCKFVAEHEQEEHQRAGKEHLAAANEVDEAAGRNAGEKCADDEQTGSEACHADGSIPSVDGISRRPEHQQEMNTVNEKVDANVKYIIARPETCRGSCICHRRRLLSNENMFFMMAGMMNRRAVRDGQHAIGIAL